MSIRLGLRLGTGAGSPGQLGPRKLSGMGLPKKGLAGRSGHTVEPQSNAPRPLLAPRHARQKRRRQEETVEGDGLRGKVMSLPSRGRNVIIVTATKGK